MTVRPARLRDSLILVLTVACAACGLQQTAPVTPVTQGGPSGALREQPTGPAYVAPVLAIGREGRLSLLWLGVEQQKARDILFAHSEDVGTSWSQPVSLKPDQSAIVGVIRLAIGSNGHVYAVWREGDPKTKSRSLQFLRSRDHGAHWDQPPRVLGEPGNPGIPEILTDQDGGVHVAWLTGSRVARALEIASSYDFGATFAPTPAHLTTAFPASQYGITNHRVTSDGKGRLYVVWEEFKSLQDQRIYLTRSPDRGKTWATPPILVSGPEGGDEHHAHSPQIIAAPGGRVYVAWGQDEARTSDTERSSANEKFDRTIYVNRSLDDGLTWLPKPIRLSETGRGSVIIAWSPQLSADQKGNVYAAWGEQHGAPGRVRLVFARSTDSGMTWSAPVRLDPGNPSEDRRLSSVQVQSDDAGHVWALWQELSLQGWQLLMNRSDNFGRSWRDRATVLAGPAQRETVFRGVAFSHDAQGRLYVAWDGGPKNLRELYVNRSVDFGTTWLSREVRVGQR